MNQLISEKINENSLQSTVIITEMYETFIICSDISFKYNILIKIILINNN